MADEKKPKKEEEAPKSSGEHKYSALIQDVREGKRRVEDVLDVVLGDLAAGK